MKINGLGPVDPVANYNKTSRSGKTAAKKTSDSISVSDEAMKTADLFAAAELVKSAPDVRLDRIAEIKAKLEDPNYINDRVVESVADSIMDAFGI
ncbi:MAG: flagellar biosynthesis anti-sigma factor FlgM [Spirochaetales bacterium]|nr:flagellar biosynthesis anti-sigma factor FlgM [Spirochaetales bacterium]